MPRYYFDVHDGIHVIDNVGRELDDIASAKLEAMHFGSVFANNPKMIGRNGGAVIVVIREPRDRTVATVRLVFSIEMEISETPI